jgi:hypothetical protein
VGRWSIFTVVELKSGLGLDKERIFASFWAVGANLFDLRDGSSNLERIEEIYPGAGAEAKETAVF